MSEAAVSSETSPVIGDPLGGLGEYELRQVVAHLAKAGKRDSLNRLLQLDRCAAGDGEDGGGTPANAWYEAKQRIGDDQGYDTDVAIAWGLADESFAQSPLGNAGEAVGWQCRYALIVTSLRSLVSRMTPEFIVALVTAGRWSLGRAIAATARMPDSSRRSRALAQLAAVGGDAEALRQLLAGVRELDDDGRLAAMADIAERFPPDALPSVLDAARSYRDESLLAMALHAAGPRLPEPALARAFREASSLHDPTHRAQALAAIGDRLPTSLADASLRIEGVFADEATALAVVSSVGSRLSASAARESLAAVRAFPPSAARALAVGRSTAALPAKDRRRVLEAECREVRALGSEVERVSGLAALGREEDALVIARQIRAVSLRARVLVAVAPHLGPRGARDALATVQGIREPATRSEVLIALAGRIPQPSMITALKLIEGVGPSEPRARALGALAPYLPPARVGRALRIALKTKDVRWRAVALRALAPKLEPRQMNMALRAVRRSRGAGPAELLLAVAPGIMTESDRQFASDLAVRRLGDDKSTEVLVAMTSRRQEAEAPALLEKVLSIDDGETARSTMQAVERALSEDDLSAFDDGDDQDEIFEPNSIVSLAPPQDHDTQPPAGGAREQWLRDRVDAVIRTAELVDLRIPPLADALEVVGEVDRRTVLHLALARVEQARSIRGDESDAYDADDVPGFDDIVPYFSKYGRLDEVVDAARSSAGHYQRAEALAAVIPFVDASQRGELAADCLSAIRDAARHRSPLLWTRRMRALTSVGSYLTPDLARRAVKLLTSVDRELKQAPVGLDAALSVLVQARLGLLPHVSPGTRDRLCSDALAATSRISSVADRATALRATVRNLPESLLPDARRLTHAIETDTLRAEALAAIARRLDDLDRPREAFAAVRDIADMIPNAKERTARRTILGTFARHVALVPTSDLTTIWSHDSGGLLRQIADGSRKDLFEDLELLVPVVVGVGGREAATRLSDAILATSRWWA